MSTTTSHTTFDAGELRRVFAEQDGPGLLALFADDATVEIADSEHPPSAPLVVDGHDAVRAWIEDILSRDMKHEIDTVAVGPDSVGYTLRCRYPDGSRVLCAATAQLRDGRIVRQVGVQAWDQG